MWHLKELTIKNLGSHRDTLMEYPEQVRLIQGKNLDDSEQDSNGSGKSLPLEALVICLIGEVFREGIRIVDLIRDCESFFELNLTMINSKLKKDLIIKRVFSHKEAQKITVWQNNEPVRKEGVEGYNKFILDELGISKEDLINYFIIHIDKFTPFFTAGDTKQKEIISRFSGADLLKGVDKEVKIEIDKLRLEIQNLKEGKSKVEGKISILEENIENFDREEQKKKDDFKEAKNKEIEAVKTLISSTKELSSKLEEEIKSVDKNIKDKDLLLTSKETLLKEQDNKLALLEDTSKIIKSIEEKEVEIKDSEETIDAIKEAKKEKENNISDLESKIANLNNLIQNSITCPSCTFKFSLQSKDFDYSKSKIDLETYSKNKIEVNIDLLEVLKDLKEVEEGLTLTKEEKTKLNNNKSKIEKDKLQIENTKKSIKSEIEFIKEEKIEISNSIEVNKHKINLNNISIKEFNERILRFEKEIEGKIKLDTSIEKVNLIENLAKIKKEKKEFEQQIIEKEEEILQEEAWISNFKRFNTYLSNKTIKSIESYSNFFLNQMKSNLQVEMEGFTLLADGKTLRETISTSILRNGQRLGTYGRFSSGEKMRITLAGIFTLQKLINLNSLSGGLAYVGADEILNSVDSKGIKSIVESISNIPMTIDVITHGTHNLANIKTLTFVKENGETTILEKI